MKGNRGESTPLTYVRMVLRQHATIQLQHTFLHRKRIRVPSQRRVRRSKIAHGRACTSSDKPYRHNQQDKHARSAPHMPLTYVRMVRRQHATSELQHTFLHRKRIRVPSQRRVRLGEIAHGRACASSDNPYRHNQQQSTHAAPLHTCPSPMEGWSAGSTRRLNSSTLSCIASASECLP